MPDTCYLIVNADDFGLTDGVNRGIVHAHRQGIVTSASLMVRAPAAGDAAGLARESPRLGLGLHFDIGEWVQRNGEWIARYQYADTDAPAAVEAELESQVRLFVQLTGKPPDHLDSHQHVHRFRPEVTAAVFDAANRLGVGVRSRDPVAYRGLYGQDRDGRSLPGAIAPDAYVAAIHALEPGITELACHPGYAVGLESDYGMEREIELQSLCDPRVVAAIAERGVRLITWGDVGAPGV
jgi:predicted glycoside hydrolase/deacetylase ChbG (UPF0249 family)